MDDISGSGTSEEKCKGAEALAACFFSVLPKEYRKIKEIRKEEKRDGICYETSVLQF